MDPTIANGLDELRQAGAFMPGTLPATPVSFAPNLAALPSNVPINSMIGIPPADEQAAVIEEIKAMMASPDPAVRARAQTYMDRFGRNMFMVGLNRATQLPFMP